MSLNRTQSSMRPHISFFGMRNAGKSSLVNSVTGQDLTIVSDKLGTTTDPVQKAMELLPLGPVVIIDTPGFDDEGELGELRVQRAKRVLNKTDIAVLVVDITKGLSNADKELILLFKIKNIPYIIAYNKSDIRTDNTDKESLLEKASTMGNVSSLVSDQNNGPISGNYSELSDNEIIVSSKTNEGIFELKEMIASISLETYQDKLIVGDMLKKDDIIILVIPIDEAAPKGRIILPQQNVLREVLDANASAICVQPSELDNVIKSLSKKPHMVITDSQAFDEVSAIVPDDIVLTSFSILLANYKGYLMPAVDGISSIKSLSDGSRVLIAEGCTHHRQCNDIGTVKIPKILLNLSGKELVFETCSGSEFPEDLSKYDLIVHCGGCMLNEREMNYRTRCAQDQNIPITNYGILFAHFNGILERSLEIFNYI